MPPPNLGDFFPVTDRKAFADRHFIIGSVFKFFCHRAQKEKRLVLIGFNSPGKDKVAFVHINTDINPNVFYSPALKNENEKLSINADRPYIDHECFVNCSDLIIRDAKEIYDMICAQPSVHIGSMTPEDFKIIRTKICNSKVLRTDRKKEYGVFIP